MINQKKKPFKELTPEYVKMACKFREYNYKDRMGTCLWCYDNDCAQYDDCIINQVKNEL